METHPLVEQLHFARSEFLRVISHYWSHTGEIGAIRQLLDHPDRPEFVGDIDAQAPYRPAVVR